MSEDKKVRILAVNSLNYEGEKIYWDTLTDFFNFSEEDFSKAKRAIEGHSYMRSLNLPSIVESKYAFSCGYEIKYKKSLSGNLNDEEEKEVFDFYNAFKNNFIEKLGKQNFMQFLTSALKSKKNYDYYDDNMTHTNYFHKVCLSDKDLREDYVKKVVLCSLSVDSVRNPRARTIYYENSIRLLKDIKDNAPDLFALAKESFFKSKSMQSSEFKLNFFNALRSRSLLGKSSEFQYFIDEFPEAKEIKNNNTVKLFDEVKLYSLKMSVDAILQLNSNLTSDEVLNIGEKLSSSLTEVFPEYTFEGGVITYGSSDIRSKSPKSIFFSFDERFGNYESVKEALGVFIKDEVHNLGYTSKSANNNCLSSFIFYVQTKDKEIALNKVMSKALENKVDVDEDRQDMGFKL